MLRFLVLFLVLSTHLHSQGFCFSNPNSGPIHHNNSSGAIYDAVSGDFNGDGFQDLVTANSVGNNISFIPGAGNGFLGTASLTSLPSNLFCICAGDFNNDTKLDVVVASSGSINVLLGNGNGTFQNYISVTGGPQPSRIYAKDINHDNVLDLIEASSLGIYVLIGNGIGSFFSPTILLNSFSINDVAIADVDNDTHLDLLATSMITSTTSEISFLKGFGNGNFASANTVKSFSYPDNFIAGIVCEDFNNDGKKDLVIANSSSSIHRLEYQSGNANGTFNAANYFACAYNPFYIYVADLDGDSKKDIVAEELNGYSILQGNANGTFNTYQHISSMTSPNTLVITDMNQDAKLDVVVPSSYFGSGLIAVNLNCSFQSIKEQASFSILNLKTYPNPSSQLLHLELDSEIRDAKITLTNAIGEIVFELSDWNGKSYQLNLNKFPRGVYCIKISNKTFATPIQKIIID